MPASIIIFLFLTGLKFPSSLYTLLSSLGVQYNSSPYPRVLYCGVIQLWLITPICSYRPGNVCPLSVYLTIYLNGLLENQILSGCYVSAFGSLPELLTLLSVSGNFCDNWLGAHIVATRNILKGTITLMVTHDLNPISCAMQELHYNFSAQ